MDGLVSMDWVGDNQVEIITCKKEISLELTGKPFAEKMGKWYLRAYCLGS